MGAAIAGDAESKISKLPGVTKARVEVVWDPPWNSSMISVAGKKDSRNRRRLITAKIPYLDLIF